MGPLGTETTWFIKENSRTYHGAEKKTSTGRGTLSASTISANCSSVSIILPPDLATCRRNALRSILMLLIDGILAKEEWRGRLFVTKAKQDSVVASRIRTMTPRRLRKIHDDDDIDRGLECTSTAEVPPLFICLVTAEWWIVMFPGVLLAFSVLPGRKKTKVMKEREMRRNPNQQRCSWWHV
jgi:hypothetical protein